MSDKQSAFAVSNQALREKIQKATEAAVKEGKYDGLKDEIQKAVAAYMADLEKQIPNYKKSE
jgi:DNA-binding protein Fis